MVDVPFNFSHSDSNIGFVLLPSIQRAVCMSSSFMWYGHHDNIGESRKSSVNRHGAAVNLWIRMNKDFVSFKKCYTEGG